MLRTITGVVSIMHVCVYLLIEGYIFNLLTRPRWSTKICRGIQFTSFYQFNVICITYEDIKPTFIVKQCIDWKDIFIPYKI